MSGFCVVPIDNAAAAAAGGSRALMSWNYTVCCILDAVESIVGA
jgi:hypothetical protein